MDPDRDFEQLIGYDGSMKRQISQAQAAVLYPPRGLHTLIHGPSGVGKASWPKPCITSPFMWVPYRRIVRW